MIVENLHEVRPEDLRRMLTLAAWTDEKARVLEMIWRIEPIEVSRILRRHEVDFALAGVAHRKGSAWRLVEPYGVDAEKLTEGGFLHALISRVNAERERKSAKAQRKSAKASGRR